MQLGAPREGGATRGATRGTETSEKEMEPPAMPLSTWIQPHLKDDSGLFP